jgi:hypothetical protein
MTRYDILKGVNPSKSEVSKEFQEVCSKLKKSKSPYMRGDTYSDLVAKIVLKLDRPRLQILKEQLKEQIENE